MKTRILIIDIITFICLPVYAEDVMKNIILNGGNISTTLFHSQEKYWNYSNVMKTLYGTKEEIGITITYKFTEWISTDADAYVRFDYLYLKEKQKLFENEKSAVIGFEFKITENLKITPNFKMTFTENNQNPKNYLAYLNCTYSF